MKVNKQQVEIIEKVLKRYNGDRARAAMHYVPCKELNVELFTRCMIEGWEIERTKNEQLTDLYHAYNKQGPARAVIKKVLKILEIKLDGIE